MSPTMSLRESSALQTNSYIYSAKLGKTSLHEGLNSSLLLYHCCRKTLGCRCYHCCRSFRITIRRNAGECQRCAGGQDCAEASLQRRRVANRGPIDDETANEDKVVASISHQTVMQLLYLCDKHFPKSLNNIPEIKVLVSLHKTLKVGVRNGTRPHHNFPLILAKILSRADSTSMQGWKLFFYAALKSKMMKHCRYLEVPCFKQDCTQPCIGSGGQHVLQARILLVPRVCFPWDSMITSRVEEILEIIVDACSNNFGRSEDITKYTQWAAIACLFQQIQFKPALATHCH